MRLLNLHSLKVQEFLSGVLPRYAAFSHTWGELQGEVLFADLAKPEGPDEETRSKLGFRKLDLLRRQAQRDGYEWAWMDTCCVDRASSADASEAVIGAWDLFARSAACYVYLGDVYSEDGMADPGAEEFVGARWFTRSWTLLELLAPRKLSFLAEDGTQVGVCSLQQDIGVLEAVRHITSIPRELLEGTRYPGEYSIAQRMSWAARRLTRRPEDTAYSLFGLFDVGLPVLYGEGRKRAFVRLQEQLARDHPSDHSLLAWTVDTYSPRSMNTGGVWAESPDDFAQSGSVVPFDDAVPESAPRVMHKGYLVHLQNRGDIQFKETMHTYWKFKPFSVRAVALNCCDAHTGMQVIVPIVQASQTHQADAVREGEAATATSMLDPPLSAGANMRNCSYSRLQMPRLELRPRGAWGQTQPRTLLLSKTPLVREDQGFAAGGIHIQNLPPAVVPPGATRRPPRDHEPPVLCGYALADVETYGAWGVWSGYYHAILFAEAAPGADERPVAPLAVAEKAPNNNKDGKDDNDDEDRPPAYERSVESAICAPAVLTVETTTKTSSGNPPFSVLVGVSNDMAYCVLSPQVRSPGLASSVGELLARGGERTHCFDYHDRSGDLAEDELQTGALTITARLRREGLVVQGSGKGHFMVYLSFVKASGQASGPKLSLPKVAVPKASAPKAEHSKKFGFL